MAILTYLHHSKGSGHPYDFISRRDIEIDPEFLAWLVKLNLVYEYANGLPPLLICKVNLNALWEEFLETHPDFEGVSFKVYKLSK